MLPEARDHLGGGPNGALAHTFRALGLAEQGAGGGADPVPLDDLGD
jgi:hypothetical protein